MPFLRTTRQMTDDPKLERIDCLLGVGTQVRGDLIFSGGLRIDGQVDGDVTVSCTDAGTLTIGDRGEWPARCGCRIWWSTAASRGRCMPAVSSSCAPVRAFAAMSITGRSRCTRVR